METLCRDCGRRPPPDAEVCPACGSVRVARHQELHDLTIAHLDCDAFYAAIEKRDRPELHDVPVIVGGRHRGVVAACCYIARTYGVRSAMPVFKALKACPDATVIKPDMKKYTAVGREVSAMMLGLTPLVEPLSIDEAFMDLSCTESLHGASPATTLAVLARRVKEELAITVCRRMTNPPYTRFDNSSGCNAHLPSLAQDVYAVGYLAFIALLVRVKRLLSGGGYSRTTPPRIRAMLLIHPVARPFPTTSTSYQGCGPVLWSTLTTRTTRPAGTYSVLPKTSIVCSKFESDTEFGWVAITGVPFRRG